MSRAGMRDRRARSSSGPAREHPPPSPRGAPVIQGTRVTLRTLLARLSDGDSIDDILTAGEGGA
ncbi:DUF433 domain-containing protein [Sorangium sp. So ce406]|uniref:DUF433 domain-containing protein n=1 Tax=Sorangium sp. So ce406 TaxID=3133311 RepID=UPI003F5CB1A0